MAEVRQQPVDRARDHAISLAIGSLAAFALGRIKLARGWLFGNFPVLTYAVPAFFLVIRLDDARVRPVGFPWAVIAADVTFTTPYAILILQQYAKLISTELDEAAQIDGATPWQIYRRSTCRFGAGAGGGRHVCAVVRLERVHLQYVLLTSERKISSGGRRSRQFFDADEAPWKLHDGHRNDLRPAAGVAIFFALVVGCWIGLTLGGVRS